MTNSVTKEQLGFAVFCIENVAVKLGLTGDVVYELLSEKSHILYDYILPCFDVLHTQDKNYIVNDIIEYMQRDGVIT